MAVFTYENQGTNTYLVYQVAEDDAVDSMSLGMLTNNRIPGLATTIFMQMDTTKYIKYNVSAKVSVRQFFNGPVNKKRLIGVFTGIVDAMLSAEDYMIDSNTILLDLDYIFADVSTCETVLICVPIANVTGQNVDLGTFFKNIVFSTQFDQTENCDYVAKIINYLNSTPMFSLYDFKEILTDAAGNQAVPVPVQQRVQPVVAPPQPKQTPAQPVIQTPPTPVQQTMPNVPPVQAPPQPINNPPKMAFPGKKNTPGTMQTPPVAPNPNMNAPVPNAVANGADDKKISMFYLLQHYNKENAALYKAQKEAKKANKGVKQTAPPAQSGFTVPGAPTQNPNFGVPTQQPPQNAGFAVPGQAAPQNAGFAVPGRQAPNQPNPGFAVPGQPTPVAPAKPVANQVKQPFAQAPQMSVPQTSPAVAPTPAPAPQQAYQPAMPQGQPMNFGETTVLGVSNIGETTVLDAIPQNKVAQPYLIRMKSNEKILLNKPVFRIGKEKSYVDYFISDNTAISRSHANVVSRDGEYFIVDTNSKNHTYVNGVMIQSNVETKLTQDAKVRLANEDFEFKIL